MLRSPVHRPPLPRFRAVRLALAAIVAAALTACGPLATGDAVRVDYRSGATYDVPAGGTLYVAADLDLADLGLAEQDVRDAGLNWIPLGIRGESANALGWIVMPPPDAPADWQVRLWEVRVIRERPLGRSDGATVSRVEATLRIDVPESAFDLTRRVTARLAARSGGSVELSFLVAAL
jgi:hypothetical protein